MNPHAFIEAYERLNPQQKQAVDTIEGPVMVIAGPGTGKTQILTLRIANILRKTDTAPENILAITFTESGAHTMRKRLHDIVGAAAYKVEINTFHGFCNMVINTYPEYFDRIIGRTAIADALQIKIIEECLARGEFKLIRPFGDPTYYVYPALSAIRDMKRENHAPSDLETAIEKSQRDFDALPDKVHQKGVHQGKMKGVHEDALKRIERNRELLVLYRMYEEELERQGYFDYEDMLLEVVRVLATNEPLLLILQETYQYILADEHQDSNRAQNQLLELLSSFHEQPNLFLVGDEKQAIYRFQGASLENFAYFERKFAKSRLITLTSNYRSTQALLDVTNTLASGPIVPKERFVPLVAPHNNKSAGVSLVACNSEEEEMRVLAERIRQSIHEGQEPHDIAVLYRNNKDASRVSDILNRYGVPHVIESNQNVLEHDEIAKLVLYLKAISNCADPHVLGKAMFIDFLGISPDAVARILVHAAQHRIPLSVMLANKELLSSLVGEVSEKVFAEYQKIISLARFAKNQLLTDSFEFILRESGFLAHVLKLPHSLQSLDALDTLFDFVRKVIEEKRDSKLDDFMEKLALVESYKVQLTRNTALSPRGFVRLMTAHKSKGQEFRVVYVIDVDEKHWGGKKDRSLFHLPFEHQHSSSDQDERRLFYVALTRGKEEVILCFAKEGADGSVRLPSPFVDELGDTVHRVEVDVDPVHTRHYMMEKKQKGVSITDTAFLKQRFLENGLAVTALNNYLECPLKFFFVNLIRLPQEQSRDQLYGIAVHFALKETIDRVVALEDVSADSLYASFLRKLSELPINENDYKDAQGRGLKSLRGYYDQYHTEWKPPMQTEVNVKGVPINLGGENIILKGVFDRIDMLDDVGRVRVIDYKTSKPKSRNVLEGKTKDSNGNEKRQLVFYKLLIDAYFSGKYTMSTGVIDFVESDTRGAYKREEFYITEEEVEELKGVLEKVVGEILSFDFLKQGCGLKDCEYCLLAQMIC